MSSSLFAIDLTESTLAWAQSKRSGRSTHLHQVGQCSFKSKAELRAYLRQELVPLIQARDQVVVLLKGAPFYYRHLTFPFNNSRKIAAAVPMEMAGKLPIPQNRLTMSWGRSTAAEGGLFSVPTLAVESSVLEQTRVQYKELGLPVTHVGIPPFALADGIARQISDGFIVHVTGGSATVGLLQQGLLTLHRNLGPVSHLPEDELAGAIVRSAAALQREAKCHPLPAILLTDGPAEGLEQTLKKLDLKVRRLDLQRGDAPVKVGQQAAAIAALGLLGTAEKFRLLFAASTEQTHPSGLIWKKSRKALIAGGLTAALTAATLVWSYQLKEQEKHDLDEQLRQMYTATLGPGGRIIDVPRQMRTELRELRDRAKKVHPGTPAPLELLSRISEVVSPSTSLQLDTFDFGELEARLGGECGDLNVLETIKNQLAALPGIDSAQILDAQRQSSGEAVRFRMRLHFETKDL